MLYFAHSQNDLGKWQSLRDHLQQVAHLASTFADPYGASALASYAGWLHDIGKIHPSFQRYLEQQPQIQQRGPDHKGAGAVLALGQHLELLAFLIAGHHGGLPSRTDLKTWLGERAHNSDVQEAIGAAKALFPELTLDKPTSSLLPSQLRTPLEAELFVRMLYSALVDADYLDTERHFRPDTALRRDNEASFEVLWEQFNHYHQHVVPRSTTSLSRIRNEVYQQCCQAALWTPGIFRLTVPTGGGKTLSSLALGLLHALEYHKQRLIYAIPYTSITEQTTEVFRGIFTDPQTVLEHHSGITPPDDPLNATAQQRWQRLAAENWDAPIIVTTTVQLFESLLARTPSACRKLHSIANSVIILDEAQMLPTHLLETILNVLQQLVDHYNVTVVLCTATQPALDQRTGFVGLQNIREIIPDTTSLFAALTRVDYHWPRSGERWSWHQVADSARKAEQVLIIVNTRADAVSIMQALNDPAALHLSTYMCGAHRRAVLQEVRRRLLAKEPCRLVATQLIEAGVDIDFPRVLRALGPFDRIVQAAGRCNREGQLTRGTLIIFDPVEGSLPPGSYRVGTDQTRSLLKEGRVDCADPATFRYYFERYYQLVDKDERHVQEVRQQFDFPEVASRFHMIDEQGMTAIIVPYQSPEKPTHVADLLHRLQQHPEYTRTILRQLQPYLVQLREPLMIRAKQQGLVQELQQGLFLWKGPYDPTYGLLLHK